MKEINVVESALIVLLEVVILDQKMMQQNVQK